MKPKQTTLNKFVVKQGSSSEDENSDDSAFSDQDTKVPVMHWTRVKSGR